MSNSQTKARSKKEQMQLARNATLHQLSQDIARDRTGTLTSTTFFVVWRLLTYMGEEGEAFPAMTTLAGYVGKDERTVRDHLKRAVVAGFLRVKRDGRRKTNVYTLAHGDRVIGTGHSGDVPGSSVLIARSMSTNHRGVEDSHPESVIGSSTQCHRVIGTEATGADHPTIHLGQIHKEDPRNRTLVRGPFGPSDNEAREELIQRLTQDVYAETHGKGRERSRRSRIASVLRDLASDGVDLMVATRGTIAMMQGPDAHNYELGGHAAAEKILRERRWESWSAQGIKDAPF